MDKPVTPRGINHLVLNVHDIEENPVRIGQLRSLELEKQERQAADGDDEKYPIGGPTPSAEAFGHVDRFIGQARLVVGRGHMRDLRSDVSLRIARPFRPRLGCAVWGSVTVERTYRFVRSISHRAVA